MCVDRFYRKLLSKAAIPLMGWPRFDPQGILERMTLVVQDETDQQKALLATIVENAEDGIISYTLDGTILTWNRGAEAIFGYSMSEAVGKNLERFVANERRAFAREYTALVCNGNSHPLWEGVGLHKKGGRIRISVRTSPQRAPDGKVRSISMIARDVTAQREAEEAKALLASIVESSEDVIHALDLKGNITTWNRGAELLFGYNKQEALGQNISMLAMADRQWRVAEILGRIRTGQSIRTHDTVVRHKDGHAVHVAISISSMVDGSGTPIGASAFLRDIGQRKRMEAALFDSEERFRATFDHAAVGMAQTALDGHFIHCNRRFAEIVGYPEDELPGMHFRQITLDEDQEESQRQTDRMLAGECCFSAWEKRYRRKDGSKTWVKLSLSLQRSPDGSPLRWIAVAEDINALKVAQKEILEIALHDPLTGLPNRRLFRERLEHSLARYSRSRNNAAVLFIDLDHLKALNDSFGHSMGDWMLREVANRLQLSTRNGDSVARLGDDEFVVILEELDEVEEVAMEQARKVAEKILTAASEPYDYGGTQCHCTASIGCALITETTPDADRALELADSAMYRAKAAGRNTICLA